MLFSLFVIHLCALAAPGPDFFFVSRTALSGRTSHIFQSASGVAIGILIWATMTLLGMNLLFEHFPVTKWIIMVLGAFYLFKLAIDIFHSAKQPLGEIALDGKPIKHVLLKGVMTNLANPKAVIYFSSVFSSIPGIGQSQGLLSQIMILIFVESLVWFFLVGQLFSLEKIRNYYMRHKRWVDYVSAGVFALFSILILADVIHLITSSQT